jgi:Fic family protein
LSANLSKRHYKGHEYVKDKSAMNLKDFHVGQESTHAGSADRQNLIIQLLKTKSDLTIKDFISTIKGCSSKTVQRELLKLVHLGVLKKAGERRWSRYSLTTN